MATVSACGQRLIQPPLTFRRTLRVYNSASSSHKLASKENALFEDFTIDGSDEVLVAA
jgi:hypothetical protein